MTTVQAGRDVPADYKTLIKQFCCLLATMLFMPPSNHTVYLNVRPVSHGKREQGIPLKNYSAGDCIPQAVRSFAHAIKALPCGQTKTDSVHD